MMDQQGPLDPRLVEYLWSAAIRLPVILISFIGIVWAIVSWKKASGSASLTLIACLMLILTSCVFPAMLVWLTPWVMQNGPPGDMRERFIMTNRMIIVSWNFATAVSLGALIVAVFAGRTAAAARHGGHISDDGGNSSDADDNAQGRFKAT